MTDAKEAARRRLQQRRARIEQEKLDAIVARNKADWERGCTWMCVLFSAMAVFVWLSEMGVL